MSGVLLQYIAGSDRPWVNDISQFVQSGCKKARILLHLAATDEQINRTPDGRIEMGMTASESSRGLIDHSNKQAPAIQ